MTQTSSFRDVEQLSAYLDGQLKPSEIARLEARLQTDPELASVLKDLRQTRNLLRQLPQRRAPRNFILTPKMVGLKPPMPRSYPVFHFATVLATLLLFFTFATNFMAPRMERVAAPYGIGGGYGGGGGGADPEMEAQLLATVEAESAAPAGPALEAPLAPAAPEMPAPAPTEGAATADESARVMPTSEPMLKSGAEAVPPGETLAQQAPPEKTPPATLIGSSLQVVLAGIAILSAIIAFAIRYITIRKWRAKTR